MFFHDGFGGSDFGRCRFERRRHQRRGFVRNRDGAVFVWFNRRRIVLHQSIATRTTLRRTVRADDERDQETAMRAGNEHGGYSNMTPRADVIGGVRL